MRKLSGLCIRLQSIAHAKRKRSRGGSAPINSEPTKVQAGAENSATSNATAGNSATQIPERQTTGKFFIGPLTRISVRTTISGSLRAEVGGSDPAAMENRLSKVVSDAIGKPLRDAGRPFNIFDKREGMPDNGSNIIIEQAVVPDDPGRGYTVKLSARQGTAIWTHSVTRPFLHNIPGNIPILPGRKTLEGKPYWDPQLDSGDLAKAFASHLGLGR
jgi:hypothetical protein